MLRAGSWPGICGPSSSTPGLSALLEVDTARCRSQGIAFALAKLAFSCSDVHHVEVFWASGRAFPSQSPDRYSMYPSSGPPRPASRIHDAPPHLTTRRDPAFHLCSATACSNARFTPSLLHISFAQLLVRLLYAQQLLGVACHAFIFSHCGLPNGL